MAVAENRAVGRLGGGRQRSLARRARGKTRERVDIAAGEIGTGHVRGILDACAVDVAEVLGEAGLARGLAQQAVGITGTGHGALAATRGSNGRRGRREVSEDDRRVRFDRDGDRAIPARGARGARAGGAHVGKVYGDLSRLPTDGRRRTASRVGFGAKFAAREARDSRRGVRGVCVSAGGRGWKDVPLVGRGVTGQEGMA